MRFRVGCGLLCWILVFSGCDFAVGFWLCSCVFSGVILVLRGACFWVYSGGSGVFGGFQVFLTFCGFLWYWCVACLSCFRL